MDPPRSRYDGVHHHPDLAIYHDRRRIGSRVPIGQRQGGWIGLRRIEEIVVIAPTKEIFVRKAAAEIEAWLKDVAADVIALVRAKGVLNDALRRQDDLVRLLPSRSMAGTIHSPRRDGNVPKDGPGDRPEACGPARSLLGSTT